MNNIEILEELKARVKLYKKSTDVQFTFTKSDIEAIENLLIELKGIKIDLKLQETENENLIQENKELKEKIPSPTNPIPIEYQTDIWVLKRDYISKSKVKEIIYGDYEDLEIILKIKKLVEGE